MKKNDKIKLESVSNIDEKIIDEVTDKKIALMDNPRKGGFNARKRIIVIAAIAATLAIMLGIFIGVLVAGSSVPVYEGMTIRNANARTLDASKYEFKTSGTSFLSAANGIGKFELLDKSNGTPNGVANGHHKDEDKELESDIQDIVTIEVATDDTVKYYVKPGQTFIIEIHISNPDNFEIQSFTLNGQKYANYMFKEGSTMELLLLEVTAPSEPGYVEYTIDAIKYIDGTEIKDVDMSSGNKSIKAGVAYPKAPAATVTSQSITPTSIELSINVTDEYSLIGENELAIYLTDGESVVQKIDLSVGDNTVKFEGLSMSTPYAYGVVTSYDLVDGKDLHYAWLLSNKITTSSAFSINNATPTKDSVTFELEQIEASGKVTSVSLYDNITDELVELAGADVREFTGLLSNHYYDLYVDFTYTSGEKEIADWVAIKGIRTIGKTAPTVVFNTPTISDSTVNGTFIFKDDEGIGSILSVDLYKDNVLLQSNSDKKIDFSGLDSYTGYEVKIVYSYDLNDGKGVQTNTATSSVRTTPYVAINSCKIANTDPVGEGDIIYMQLSLNNPSNATPTSVVIGGRTYTCTSTAGTGKVFVDIVNDGQFKGGETTLTVDKINVSIGSRNYSISVTENNSDSVFIRINLNYLKVIESIRLVTLDGEEYVERDVFKSEKLYLKLTLANQSEYKVDSVKISTYQNNREEIDIPADELTVLADGDYLIEVTPTAYGSISYDVTIAYSSPDGIDTSSSSASASTNRFASDDIKYISTPEDLLNMNGEFYYYELTGDIDLDGISHVGADFNGVFNGCGYSIKNFTRVGAASSLAGQHPDTNPSIGLFKHGSGVIKNVNMRSVTLILDCKDYGGYIGALVGYMDGTIDNCHVDIDSVIKVQGAGSSTVGGIAGHASKVINSNNFATVDGTGCENITIGGIAGDGNDFENCKNYGAVSGGQYAGGIAGSGYNFTSCENFGAVIGAEASSDRYAVLAVGGITSRGFNFVNCTNHGAVSGGTRVCGIVGEMWGDGKLIACANYGRISGYENVGGIATGVQELTIVQNCVNYGTITATHGFVGGIIGSNTYATVEDCANFGALKAAEAHTVGGIAADSWGGSFYNCISASINENSNGDNITGNGSKPTLVNCYFTKELTTEQLNSKDFYINTLGWDETVWNFDDLDFANGKYPTLR